MPPKKNKAEANLMERKKDAIVDWFKRRARPDTMNVIEVAIQNDWTADKSLKPGGKFKDLLKELIEEGRVQQKKCGVATVFWVFPATEMVRKVNSLNECAKEISTLGSSIEKLKMEWKKNAVGKQDSYDRQVLLLQQAHFGEKNAQMQAELDCFRDNDPAFISDMEQRIRESIEAINIVTEGIFVMGKFITILNLYGNHLSYEEILAETGCKDADSIDYIVLPPELRPKGDDVEQNIRHDLSHQKQGLIRQQPKPLILPQSQTRIHPAFFAKKIPYEYEQLEHRTWAEDEKGSVLEMRQDDEFQDQASKTLSETDTTSKGDKNDKRSKTDPSNLSSPPLTFQAPAIPDNREPDKISQGRQLLENRASGGTIGVVPTSGSGGALPPLVPPAPKIIRKVVVKSKITTIDSTGGVEGYIGKDSVGAAGNGQDQRGGQTGARKSILEVSKDDEENQSCAPNQGSSHMSDRVDGGGLKSSLGDGEGVSAVSQNNVPVKKVVRRVVKKTLPLE